MSLAGLSRVGFGGRVLLPESFVWVRLFQICTFGALGLDTAKNIAYSTTIESLPCNRSIVDSILSCREDEVKG